MADQTLEQKWNQSVAWAKENPETADGRIILKEHRRRVVKRIDRNDPRFFEWPESVDVSEV